MKRVIIKGMLSVILLFSGVISYAQRATDLRINEVLTYNVNNYIDGLGIRNGWIEIFNSSYGTVDIGGCYITNDKSNPTKYYIPKGNVNTSIKPQQFLVFFADNNRNSGIFHLNFEFKSSGENYVALYDTNGTTLIDEINIPALSQDQSFGRTTDGGREFSKLSVSTPLATNVTKAGMSKADRFIIYDPYGLGMAIIAMAVVFTALLILFITFKRIGIMSINMSRKRERKAREASGNVTVNESALDEDVAPGEVYACISLALHEFQDDSHDLEDTVLTISRVARSYSPWSSKIYGVRQFSGSK